MLLLLLMLKLVLSLSSVVLYVLTIVLSVSLPSSFRVDRGVVVLIRAGLTPPVVGCVFTLKRTHKQY